MTFDSRSADLQPVDLVVSHGGVPDRTAFMPWHKYRSAAAMLAFVAGLLRAAVVARADASARPEGTAERAGMDSARVQPTARTSSRRPISQTLASAMRAPSTTSIACSSVHGPRHGLVPASGPRIWAAPSDNADRDS
jgi:hypothetical protein